MARTPAAPIEAEVKPLARIEQFQTRLAQGELKSIADWAMDFFDHDTLEYQMKIRQMMGALRRRGIMCFPIPSGVEGEPSTVKIVNRNLTDFVSAFNRHASQTVEPGIVASFRIAETLIKEFPKTRDQVVARAKALIETAAESQKNLLGLPYGKSEKLLGSGSK